MVASVSSSIASTTSSRTPLFQFGEDVRIEIVAGQFDEARAPFGRELFDQVGDIGGVDALDCLEQVVTVALVQRRDNTAHGLARGGDFRIVGD